MPHGGLQLQPSSEKPSCQEQSDLQAVSAAILVTYHADFRGDVRFCRPPSGRARVFGSGLGGYFEGVCGAPKGVVYVAFYVIPPRNP